MTHKRFLSEVYREFSSPCNKNIPLKEFSYENEMIPYKALKARIVEERGEFKMCLGDKIVSNPIVSYEGFSPFMQKVISIMNKWKSSSEFSEFMKYASSKYSLVRAIEDSIPNETQAMWDNTTSSLIGMYKFINEIADQNATFQNQIIKMYGNYMNAERAILKSDNIRYVPEIPNNLRVAASNIVSKVNMDKFYIYPFEDLLKLLKFIAEMDKTPVICSLAMSTERPTNTALVLYAFRNILYTHKTGLRLKCFDGPINEDSLTWVSSISKEFSKFTYMMENPITDIANHPQWYLELEVLGKILSSECVSEILPCTASELTRTVFNV